MVPLLAENTSSDKRHQSVMLFSAGVACHLFWHRRQQIVVAKFSGLVRHALIVTK